MREIDQRRSALGHPRETGQPLCRSSHMRGRCLRGVWWLTTRRARRDRAARNTRESSDEPSQSQSSSPSLSRGETICAATTGESSQSQRSRSSPPSPEVRRRVLAVRRTELRRASTTHRDGRVLRRACLFCRVRHRASACVCPARSLSPSCCRASASRAACLSTARGRGTTATPPTRRSSSTTSTPNTSTARSACGLLKSVLYRTQTNANPKTFMIYE